MADAKKKAGGGAKKAGGAKKGGKDESPGRKGSASAKVKEVDPDHGDKSSHDDVSKGKGGKEGKGDKHKGDKGDKGKGDKGKGDKPSNLKGKGKKTDEEQDHEAKDKKDMVAGVTVYQIEVRFIVFKGLRFCAGVRVIMNCPEEQAYLQLITQMNEVFSTYDITNMYFLEPKSAAGVSFCAVPWVNKDAQQEEEEEPSQETENVESDFEKQRKQRCKERKGRTTALDHVEIVFCAPEQMIRFKTVIDTLLCAISCDDDNTQRCLNTQAAFGCPTSECGHCPHETGQDDSNFEEHCFDKPPLPPPSPSPPPSYIPPSLPSPSPPPTSASKDPCAPCDPCDPGQSHCYDPGVKKLGMYQVFDPCPGGPVATSVCLPCDLGDPYQLYPEEGRVVFCTPACLQVCCRSGRKLVYKGKLKIVQGTGGIGFVIRIESVEGATLYCHSLRRDLTLYKTSETNYGFCYTTVVCTSGKTSMETFCVAFPSCYQMDQFKHAVNTCKDILGMTSVQCLINQGCR